MVLYKYIERKVYIDNLENILAFVLRVAFEIILPFEKFQDCNFQI